MPVDIQILNRGLGIFLSYIFRKKKRRIKLEKIERDHEASGHGRGYDLILEKDIVALKQSIERFGVACYVIPQTVDSNTDLPHTTV